ncbi:hypothetical protein A7982_12085 [Minicystis rosea]|nr:hypothetical protein A7982_12085 [Minicystis rosea]
MRLEEALALATSLRQERMHGRDDVFVIRETDGAVMDGGGIVAELPQQPQNDGARTDAPLETQSTEAAEEIILAAPPTEPSRAHASTPPNGLDVHSRETERPNGDAHIEAHDPGVESESSESDGVGPHERGRDTRPSAVLASQPHAAMMGRASARHGAGVGDHTRDDGNLVIENGNLVIENGSAVMENGHSAASHVHLHEETARVGVAGQPRPVPLRPAALAALITSLDRARHAAERAAAARRRFEQSAAEIAEALERDSAPPEALLRRQAHIVASRALAEKAAASFADATALVAAWIEAATRAPPAAHHPRSAATGGRVSSAGSTR